MRLAALLAVGAALAGASVSSSQGRRAEAAFWTASLAGAHAARGRPATVDVVLVARGGFHVNEEYPLQFRPAPSAAVRFAKERFDRADGLRLEPCAPGSADACTARLAVSFTPEAAGTLTLSGTLKFSVCNPEKCLIEQVDLAAPLESAGG